MDKSQAAARKFRIGELDVPPSYLAEVIRCIAHTILFCRSFGVTTPTESTVDFLDISYPRVDDKQLEKRVDESIDAICNSFIKRRSLKCQVPTALSGPEEAEQSALDIALLLYAGEPGSWYNLFSAKAKPFEQWVFALQLSQPLQSSNMRITRAPKPDECARLQKSLRAALESVLTRSVESTAHVADVSLTDLADKSSPALTYHFALGLVNVEDEENYGLFSAMKDMLRSAY
eukprot:m51a1_g12151 hypothetical protein (232) ;mRNA; f:649-1854